MVDLREKERLESLYTKFISSNEMNEKEVCDFVTDSIRYIQSLSCELVKLREIAIENLLKE